MAAHITQDGIIYLNMKKFIWVVGGLTAAITVLTFGGGMTTALLTGKLDERYQRKESAVKYETELRAEIVASHEEIKRSQIELAGVRESLARIEGALYATGHGVKKP